MALWWAVNVHAGSPLPLARAVIVAVPTLVLVGYLWVSRRRRP
ncbi:MAG: hypothetical protein ACRDV0_00130 [Acidimicrobiales bacterium]